MLRSIPLSLSWKKTAGETRTPRNRPTEPGRSGSGIGARSHAKAGDRSPQGGHRVPGGAIGDTATGPGPPIQGSGRRNREDGRCRHGGENRERSMHGNGDVRGVAVGPGRRLSGCGSPSGQETGRQRGTEQEGSRRPRGRRKNGGKARGHSGGGGRRKPDPARDCPGATCVPWRVPRLCLGTARTGTGRACGGTETSLDAGKGPFPGETSAANASLPPLGGCRPWRARAAAARRDLQPRAAAWEILQPALRRCRLGTATRRVCAGDRTPGTPPAVAGEAVLLPTGLLAGV